MTTTDHQILIQDLFAALTGYDLATLHLLLAPEVVCHLSAPGGAIACRGVEGVVRVWTACYHRGGPGIAIEEVLSGEDHAVALCAARQARGVVVTRFEAGRVAEVWVYGFSVSEDTAEGIVPRWRGLVDT